MLLTFDFLIQTQSSQGISKFKFLGKYSLNLMISNFLNLYVKKQDLI